ncbi:MAG: hypothetical protein WAS21_17470 [Geminicoccaceae bacterium]
MADFGFDQTGEAVAQAAKELISKGHDPGHIAVALIRIATDYLLAHPDCTAPLPAMVKLRLDFITVRDWLDELVTSRPSH